ncbi:MAG: SAM-dependent methyltransferase [Crocinitomicaceae bacterium]|nr:SAM-dependent methyltransferase [Crocinitomicaceae bacterium]
MKKENWFENWFDTPWYHQLYCNHDFDEANRFIENLIAYLNPPNQSKILDLACGKGRHAMHINRLGYSVWGVDLSERSISSASKSENEHLKFSVHDMRMVFKPSHFDYIFNLFTSFGYFNAPEDNHRVMQSVCDGLKSEGIFVLDFLNASKVKNTLVSKERITKEDIEFSIHRQIRDNVILKEIDFDADGKHHHFEERVTAFELKDLEALFKPVRLSIIDTFGNYSLDKFNEEDSDRLILVAQKKTDQ